MKNRKRLVFLVAALGFACCVGVGLVAIVAPETGQQTKAPPESGRVASLDTQPAAPTLTDTPPPAPTNTPLPTDTLVPTNTLAPSPTSLPAGTPGPVVSGRTDGAAHVLQVIDGDTIEVEIDGQAYRVRYIGMDIPGQDTPFHQEATGANAALVADQDVWLEKDVSETDADGRLLRYVHVGDTMVNEALLRQGYARVATYPPNVKYQDRLLAAQQAAQAAGLGLWAQAVVAPTPAEPLPVQPVATVVPAPPSNCDPSYPDVCIPPPPPDLNCGDVAYRRFTVVGSDPHGFDNNKDGVGCER
jgi:micrococcal nuclease